MYVGEVPPEAITIELERILQSRTFANADRSSRFLRFVVEQALQNPESGLKEYPIGVAVLGRGESFDPRTDSIVRVEAGRLRARLKDYYQEEGRNDSVVIGLPKGSYVPAFEQRHRTLRDTSGEGSLSIAGLRGPVAAARRAIRGLTSRPILLIAAASLLTVVGITAIVLDRRHDRPAHIRSLAVLPLTNVSGDPGQEYLTDGLTDLLIANVSRIPGLRVISRTSVMGYKGSTKALRQIAKELRVDAVLEGSLMRSENRVRITAKLIHAPEDRHLWAEVYEADLGDVLSLQAEVARAVANHISAKFSREEYGRLKGHRQVHPQALDAYLKGRYFASKRTEESLKKSVEYFRLAIEQDPAYAPAHSGLGEAYVLLITNSSVSAREYHPKVKTAALRALELDATLAEPHVLLGQTFLFHNADWPAARREYRRAIELDPQFATAHQRYALNLMWLGRFQEALQANKRAQELDPLSPILAMNEAEIYYNSRDYDRAIEHCRKLIEREPNFYIPRRVLGEAYTAKRMYKEAISEFQRVIAATAGPRARGMLAHAYAVSGNKSAAMQILDELVGQGEPLSYDIGVVYTGLGDKDRAFEWLRRSCDERSRARIFLRVAPVLDGLRSDPRFSDLLRRVDLKT